MPIDITYAPPLDALAQAALVGGEGPAAEEARRFQEQLGQRDRQFDLDYNARLYLAQQDDATRRAQMALQNNQYFAGLGADLYRQNLTYDLGQQQVEQQAQNRQLQFQGQMATQLAQAARQQSQQKMQQFMADREAVLKSGVRGRQLAQAKAQLEQHYGMPWGLPEQLMQEQDQQTQQQRIASIQQHFFTDPVDGSTIATPEAIQAMFDIGMTGAEVVKAGMSRITENRNQRKLEQDQSQVEAKAADAWNQIDIKAADAMQKLEHDDKQNQAEFTHKLKMDALEFKAEKAKAIRQATMDYNKDVREWMKAKRDLAGDKEGEGALGPKPEWKDYDPSAAFAEEPGDATGGGGASSQQDRETDLSSAASDFISQYVSGSASPGERVKLPNGRWFEVQPDHSLKPVP